jgi:hypothetical protein
MNSARYVENPLLRTHFSGMAKMWSTLAERGPFAETKS